MSLWTEQPTQDDDPLDPTRGLPASPASADAQPEQDEEGVADPSGAVRVRLDEEGFRVVELRVSTRWRERLDRADLEIDRAVLAACRRAQLQSPRRLVVPPVEHEAPTGRRRPASEVLDWAEFARLHEKTLALVQEGARLRQRPPAELAARLLTPPAVGTAAEGRVRVELSPAGPVAAVHVDRRWSREQARVTELAAALNQAVTAAYDVWQPPEHDTGELGRLVERSRDHRRRLVALVAGRDHRTAHHDEQGGTR